ncbi:hypothetical protein AD942_10850 [Gluconobacter japonicus]|nr:hypothetical protein AD942_10850 [Gluconobacter japonicus]KXV55089.1 hypothetical protein AD936_08145 [Gluconobacter japonicus]
MMRAVLLCLVLAGCAQSRMKVVCPALHPWTADFQKQMAAEIREHRMECPNLIESALQMEEVRRKCAK